MMGRNDGIKGAVAAASLALLLVAGCGTQEEGRVVGEGPVSGTAGTKSGDNPGASATAHPAGTDTPGTGSAGTGSAGAATGNSGGTSPSPR